MHEFNAVFVKGVVILPILDSVRWAYLNTGHLIPVKLIRQGSDLAKSFIITSDIGQNIFNKSNPFWALKWYGGFGTADMYILYVYVLKFYSNSLSFLF